jgi:hypothetical protein
VAVSCWGENQINCLNGDQAVTIKSVLTAAALATLIASPAFAQVAPSMGGREPLDQKEGVQTPETLGAGRSQASPEGGNLARPADPHVQAEGQRQPGTIKEGDTAATSVKPPPGSSSQGSGEDEAKQK